MSNEPKPNVPPMASHVEVRKDGTVGAYVGPEAVDFFRARVLASSLSLYFRCGILPTRGVTMSRMLAMATAYTGEKYKRNRFECARAAEDLNTMIQAQAAILPHITRD